MLGTPKATLDHADPFHVSLVELPTAMHAAGPVQDTPLRSSTGLGTSNHVVPFHISATVPAAAQKLELVQDTPLKELSCVGGVAGLDTTAHETPGLV